MNKAELKNKIIENFLNDDIKYDVEELGEEIKKIHPIFGDLKIEIENLDETTNSKIRKTIRYIDEDIIYEVIDSKTESLKILENSMDMSTDIIRVDIDENGKILVVENSTNGMFTNANKVFALFSSYLIGKTIIVK